MHLCAAWRLRLLLSLAVWLLIFPASAKKKPPVHPINLNTARASELQQVQGIGPSTGEKILQMRKSYGAFKSVDDLLAIKGIGPKKLDKMRKYLTVEKAPAKKTGTQGDAVSAQSKAPPAKSPQAKSAPAQKPTPQPASSEDEEP
jgi:competence ComEA-like helix-hairpin-helix protein